MRIAQGEIYARTTIDQGEIHDIKDHRPSLMIVKYMRMIVARGEMH